MNRPQQELTLRNVFTDPMVKIAMAADDVDPHATGRDAFLCRGKTEGSASARPQALPLPGLSSDAGHSAARPAGGSSQRAASSSSVALASTQLAPSAYSTCFQNGARVLRKSIRNSAAANAS